MRRRACTFCLAGIIGLLCVLALTLWGPRAWLLRAVYPSPDGNYAVVAYSPAPWLEIANSPLRGFYPSTWPGLFFSVNLEMPTYAELIRIDTGEVLRTSGVFDAFGAGPPIWAIPEERRVWVGIDGEFIDVPYPLPPRSR